MERQSNMNIGMLGCVSEGKSTLVLKLTKIKTQKHSNELKKNITIKPGYANLKIYRKDNEYTLENTEECVHHLSFIDCPGHHQLIQTMLGNLDLMSGVIVVVSLENDISCKPKLVQHLLAAKLAKLDNMIILLNKLDLISKDVAIKRKKQLDDLLEKLEIVPKEIIPVCLNKELGINFILNSIMKHFSPNILDNVNHNKSRFYISRSFDINKSNTNILNLNGGIIGGSLTKGKIKVGDVIEIKPGIQQGNNYKILKSKVLSLKSDQDNLDYIMPGGLIGIGTEIDPFYCKNDALTGNLVGLEGTLPDVFEIITINLLDTKNTLISNWDPKANDIINLQISTKLVKGKLLSIKKNIIICKLNQLVCLDYNTSILLTSNNSTCDIIGYGVFIDSSTNHHI
jgi:translation initiation factor 2 subunit 3